LISKIETILNKNGLKEENIIIRLTGCPNGCARPYAAEVGFVGTATGRYNMHLGGDHQGTRLNKIYKESLDEETILSELEQLFATFKLERNVEERFGDFVMRKGIVT
jgi:sulfite reductase (NADPH) hemoprotein beta-component